MSAAGGPQFPRDAACAGHPRPELWDLSVGDNERRQSRNARHELAKQVCDRCPVQVECAADVDPERDEGFRAGRRLRALTRPADYGDVQGVVRKHAS